ncbi:MAG: hypothetical protein WC415_04125 [Patescibacteria group bacterium]|jgi:hypothetical protein
MKYEDGVFPIDYEWYDRIYDSLFQEWLFYELYVMVLGLPCNLE